MTSIELIFKTLITYTLQGIPPEIAHLSGSRWSLFIILEDDLITPLLAPIYFRVVDLREKKKIFNHR